MKKTSIPKNDIIPWFLVTVGAIVYATGQLVFIKPLHIPMGGIAGVALLLNYLFSLPIGLMTLIFNIPLYFLGWRTMGSSFFYKTVYANVVSALWVDLMANVIPGFSGEMVISALYGGIVMGTGLGLILRGGGTSGGTDIVSKWLNRKKDIPVGTMNFSINVVVILVSAFFYKSADSALYALISSFLSGHMIDRLVYGMDVQKEAVIITSRPEEVSREIMGQLKHGVTAMDATGMYTGDQRTMLLCVVHRHETGTLKKAVLSQDENAFLMISNINEVFGKGFKQAEK